MARPGPRRRTVADEAGCTYAAVGATASLDLLAHPPKGFVAAEYRALLGSGRERFEKSIRRLMRFGVQRGAGLLVRDIVQPTRSLDAYRGLEHDADGDGATHIARPYASLFDADDPLLVRPGTTADIVTKVGPFTFSSPVRVIAVIAEEREFGFAYGTLPGGPESGEQRFLVSWLPDDSVRITIREFVKPGSWWIRFVWPYANAHRKRVIRAYLAALHPSTPRPRDDRER